MDENNIIYCDNHLLIINKPAGLLSQPDDKKKYLPNQQEIAISWLKSQNMGKFLHPVHRLDKLVSGVLVFARTRKALSRINAQVREKTVVRMYEALVEGNVKEDTGILENYLIHRDYFSEVADKDNKKAKLAQLKYKVLERKDNNTRVEITLGTGRYHQIRAQMAHITHPIVGDGRYGSVFSCDKILLHCKRIELLHPTTKKQLVFAHTPAF
jgi:23S rRNA pseudouridine1911/1915/1917 synthase